LVNLAAQEAGISGRPLPLHLGRLPFLAFGFLVSRSNVARQQGMGRGGGRFLRIWQYEAAASTHLLPPTTVKPSELAPVFQASA